MPKMSRTAPLVVSLVMCLVCSACCSVSPLTRSQRKDIRWRERVAKERYKAAQGLIASQRAEGALLIVPAQKPSSPKFFTPSQLLTGKSALDVLLKEEESNSPAFAASSGNTVCMWIPKESQSLEPSSQPCSQLRDDVERVLMVKVALADLRRENKELLAQIESVSVRAAKIDAAVKEQKEGLSKVAAAVKEQEESLSKVAAGLATALSLSLTNDTRLNAVSEQVEESLKAFQKSSGRLQDLINGTTSLAAVLQTQQAETDAKLKQVLDTIKAIR